MHHIVYTTASRKVVLRTGKGLRVNVESYYGQWLFLRNLKVFQRGGRKQHKQVFVLSRSLLLNRLEPQSSKAKLLLLIMPIGIVAYAFTLS